MRWVKFYFFLLFTLASSAASAVTIPVKMRYNPHSDQNDYIVRTDSISYTDLLGGTTLQQKVDALSTSTSTLGLTASNTNYIDTSASTQTKSGGLILGGIVASSATFTSLRVSTNSTFDGPITFPVFTSPMARIYSGPTLLGRWDSRANTSWGFNAFSNANLAVSNSAFGRGALSALQDGAENTAAGYNALASMVGGGRNSSYGYFSGTFLTDGSSNTLMGALTPASPLVQTLNRTSLFGELMTVSGVLFNASAIGYGVSVECSSCVVLGNSDVFGVGIGTGNPTAKLDVYNGSFTVRGANAQISVSTPSDGTVAPIISIENAATNEAAGTSSALYFGVRGGFGKKAGILARQNSNFGRADLHFFSRDANDQSDGGYSDSKMTVQYTGNVGIGTNSPSSKLDVLNGSITVRGTNSGISAGTGTFINVLGVGTQSPRGKFEVANGTITLPAAGAFGLAYADTVQLWRYDANENVAWGPSALKSVTSGGLNNTALGSLALRDNTTGDSNTAIGRAAGATNVAGNNNISIGASAGNGLTNLEQTILLGAFASSLDNLTNAIAIGYNASVTCSSCIVLGNTNISNVGIGTDTPSSKFNVVNGSITARGTNAGLSINVGTFTVSTVGNVGVGTENPSSRFELVSGSITVRGTNAGMRIATTGVGGTNRALDVFSGTFTVLQNGNVGIGLGATASSAKLQVAGGGTQDIIVGNSGNSQNLLIGNGSGNSQISAILQGTGFNTLALNPSGGNVGIGTLVARGHFDLASGSIAYKTAGTLWANPSDGRLKDILGNYSPGVDAIASLQVKRFRFKEGNVLRYPSDDGHIGLVAQDVEQVFPEAVSRMENGFLSLDADPIFWAMVNSIKELKQKNDRLQNLICGNPLFSGNPICQQ